MLPTTGERSDIPQSKHISCTTRSRQEPSLNTSYLPPSQCFTYHMGETRCDHFPGTTPPGGCKERWCHTSSRTHPPSHQNAPGPCHPGCPPQWPHKSGLCSCDPQPPTSSLRGMRWESPSAGKRMTTQHKVQRVRTLGGGLYNNCQWKQRNSHVRLEQPAG